MSSHREAPEISKDPVADNTDTYAFVSPDRPGHRDDHQQLHPARGPGRRPELLRVRRRRAVQDQHRQHRRRSGGHRLRVPVQHEDREQGHVPLQHRADRQGQQPQLQPAADLHRHRGPRHQAHRAGQGSADAAVQHRTAVHPELRRPWPTRPSPRSGPASRSSPGNVSTGSTSISARSSTWRCCDRSRTCT